MLAMRPVLLLLGLLWGSSAPLAGTTAAEPAFDFTMTDLDGREHRLTDYRGQWVILNYWATWCPPCIEELPELAAFQAANPDCRVLGINFEDIAPDEVRAFAAEHGINYPVLPTGPTPPAFARLRGLPTTQIIDPAGRLVADHVGTVTRQMLEDFIRAKPLDGAPAAAAR